MVDGLVAHDEVSTTSRLELNEQNIFCKNGYFHETGLIENIAQTAALRAGYTAHMNNIATACWLYWCYKKNENILSA